MVDSDGDSSFEVLTLGDGIGLGVGSWDTWGGSEMSLGFSVLGSSK